MPIKLGKRAKLRQIKAGIRKPMTEAQKADLIDPVKGGFRKGGPGGPGRPIGSVSGRNRAIQWLDKILNKKVVAARISKALEDFAMKAPIRFYKEIVMPLVPKAQLQDVTPTAKLAVRITMTRDPAPLAAVPATPALPQPRSKDKDTVDGEIVSPVQVPVTRS